MPPEDDKTKGGAGSDAGNDDKGGAGGGAGGSGGATGDDTSALKSALAKERKRAAEAEAKVKNLEASINDGKSDSERVAATLQELRDRADAADRRAMIAEVAVTKGLTTAQARRLQGNTIEEMEADADELLAAFKPGDGTAGDAAGGTDAANGGQQQRPASAARPRENLRAGTATSSTDQAPEYDSKTFLAAVPRG